MAMSRWRQGSLLGMVSAIFFLALALPAGADVLQFESEAAEPPAWERRLSYRDLAFGESPQSVRNKLGAFKFLAEEDAGDTLVFSGTVIGREAKVRTAFTPGSRRLKEVTVHFSPPSGEAIDCYRQVLTILRAKYRAPRTSCEIFQDPFDAPHGHAEAAIRAGKGHFVTSWGLADGEIACRIERDLTVALRYESRVVSRFDEDGLPRAMQDEL